MEKINQPIKFIIVGLINTAISFSIYTYLTFCDLNYIIALIISYCVGMISSFILNNKWTFKENKGKTEKRMLKFLLVYLLNLVINALILIFFVDFLQGNEFFSQIIALILTTLLSYIGHKYWTFKGEYNK